MALSYKLSAVFYSRECVVETTSCNREVCVYLQAHYHRRVCPMSLQSRAVAFCLVLQFSGGATACLARSSMESPSPAQSSTGSSASSQPQDNSASAVLRALAAAEPIPRAASGVSKQIDDLLAEQKKIRAERAQIARDLKNAQRRKARLKHKARLLSASDLASVLVLRQEEEATRSKTTKRRRSSQPDTTLGEEVGSGRHVQETHDRDASDVDHEREEADAPADAP